MPEPDERLSCVTIALLFLAVVFLGVGQILILPPFEGLDETAHYSSIKQIADTGHLPMMGSAYMAQEIADYAVSGPMPYEATDPLKARGAFSYPEFFQDAAREANYRQRYRLTVADNGFKPGAELNWQAQHPPLYYGLLALIAKSASGLSLTGQLLALRLASDGLALIGFLIALRATIKSGIVSHRAALAGFFAYPLLVPEFFPEFGRLGNDSLCLLLMGVVWAFFLWWLRDEFNMPLTFALGGALGLGLMTKAFFLPISAAFFCFTLFRLWQGRGDRKLMRDRYEMLFPLFLPCFLAGFWYLYQAKAYGSVSGSVEAGLIGLRGGLVKNLANNFSAADLWRRLSGLFRSWVWGGTASLGQWPAGFTTVLAVADIALIAAGLRKLRTADAGFLLFPVVAVLFFGSLLYHMLTLIALQSEGGTPGWYFSILLPMIAAVIARGYGENSWVRRLLPIACIYGACFLAVGLWGEVAEFSGCALRDEQRLYIFTKPLFCAGEFGEMMRRLNVLAYPAWGLSLIVAGFVLYGCGLVLVFKRAPVRAAI